MKRLASGVAVFGAAGALLLAPMVVAPATAATNPVPKFDYSMPDNIGPLVGVLPPATDKGREWNFTGMFVPQNPMQEVIPEYQGTNYGQAPADGLYEVTLDACASTVGTNPIFDWRIAGKRFVVSECKHTVRLPEGDLDYTLRIIDDGGQAAVTGKMTVKNVLLAIVGDSYASGEGFPPFRVGSTNSIAWDSKACDRSRWSGFVRSAAQMEAADPRSNVTVLNVACSGATVTEGILGPKSGMPAQIKQLNDLRNGQQIDQVFLSIGGNDIGFGDILLDCGGSDGGCFQDQMNPTDNKLAKLPQRYADTAACLNNGDCKITPLGGGDKVSEPPLKLVGKNVIQTAYPNLVSGPANPTGYAPNTNKDNLCNVGTGYAPLLYGDSWWGTNVAINGVKGRTYQIPNWPKGPDGSGDPSKETLVPFTPTADGIALQFVNNATSYGWTFAPEPYVDTTVTPGGLCAYTWYVKEDKGYSYLPPGQEDNLALFQYSIAISSTTEGAYNPFGSVHPNNRGQEIYRKTLAPKGIKLASLPVPAATAAEVPGPAMLAPPSALTVKSLKKATKKKRHVRISFTAPTSGPTPSAYKVRVEVPGKSAQTIRDALKGTSTTWKQAPRGKKVKVRVASYIKGSPQQVQWGPWTTAKVKK